MNSVYSDGRMSLQYSLYCIFSHFQISIYFLSVSCLTCSTDLQQRHKWSISLSGVYKQNFSQLNSHGPNAAHMCTGIIIFLCGEVT